MGFTHRQSGMVSLKRADRESASRSAPRGSWAPTRPPPGHRSGGHASPAQRSQPAAGRTESGNKGARLRNSERRPRPARADPRASWPPSARSAQDSAGRPAAPLSLDFDIDGLTRHSLALSQFSPPTAGRRITRTHLSGHTSRPRMRNACFSNLDLLLYRQYHYIPMPVRMPRQMPDQLKPLRGIKIVEFYPHGHRPRRGIILADLVRIVIKVEPLEGITLAGSKAAAAPATSPCTTATSPVSASISSQEQGPRRGEMITRSDIMLGELPTRRHGQTGPGLRRHKPSTRG